MDNHLSSNGFELLWGNAKNGVARVKWNRNGDEYEGKWESGVLKKGRCWKQEEKGEKKLNKYYEGDFKLHDNGDGTGYLMRYGLGTAFNRDGTVYQEGRWGEWGFLEEACQVNYEHPTAPVRTKLFWSLIAGVVIVSAVTFLSYRKIDKKLGHSN